MKIKIGKGTLEAHPGHPTAPVVIKSGSGHTIVHRHDEAKCELCGNLAELRPYGPKGEFICFDCGMKNEKTTAKQFGKQFK